MTLTKRGKDWNEGYKQGALVGQILAYTSFYHFIFSKTQVKEIEIFKFIDKRLKELEKEMGLK